jgi:hypothetical protein
MAPILSAVVDSGVLEYGWVLTADWEKFVLFVKLAAGGGSTAVPANIVLLIVIKSIFIRKTY